MDRQYAIKQAAAAARKAASLAAEAERHAHHPDYAHKTRQYAEAGAVWADTARAFTALAEALPEELPEVPPATVPDADGDH